MKKTLLSLLTLSAFGAYSQNVVFNDPALKQKIVLHDQNVVGGVSGPNISLIDTDLNGEISITEAQAYTGRLYLNQNGSNFYTDLTGLEEFINVTELFCQNNQMTTLDVSANTALTLLDCEYNQITTLDLSNNVNLTTLNYSYNNLPNVNLSTLGGLTQLVCDHANIINIDLASNTNLEVLTCEENSITSLNLANNVNLTNLTAHNNQLTSLDLSLNTNLTSLICNNNNIASINFGAIINIDEVLCHDNNIVTLDLSNFNDLEYVDASDNLLTSVSLPTTTSTETINFSNNNLTQLDASGLAYLYVLNAQNNEISSIDFSNNIYLEYVLLNNNNIESIDLSTQIVLSYLVCEDNELSFLDVSNGNNTSVTTFSALNNPDLMCIEVDDAAYSTTNWTSIDAQTSFSLDCPTMVNDITVAGQSGATTITTDGGTLQMMADVLPANATDATYTWSVTNGTGAATIDAAGLLTATHNGTVTVIATANDGSGITGSEEVIISNQTAASINSNDVALNMSMFPNPTTGIVNFETTAQIESIEVYNLIGEKVNVTLNTNTINIKELPNGIYVVKIKTNERVSVTKKLVKK